MALKYVAAFAPESMPLPLLSFPKIWMFDDREALEVLDLTFHDQISFAGGFLVQH